MARSKKTGNHKSSRNHKKSSNAWLNFLVDFRRRHPYYEPIAVVRLGAVEWRKMNEAQRRKYKKEALKYRKPTAPLSKMVHAKPTSSPYLNFLMEYRKQCSDMEDPLTSIMQNGADVWRVMDACERHSYVKQAKRAKKRLASNKTNEPKPKTHH